MRSATTTDPRLDAIVAQRRRLEAEQQARDERVAAETRRLAELIDQAATGADPISYDQAGKAMGKSKTYAYGLATKLRAGKL